MAKKVKLTVNITEDELNSLREQADTHGITVTDALRRGLLAGRLFEETKKNSGRVLLEGPSGVVRQAEIF